MVQRLRVTRPLVTTPPLFGLVLSGHGGFPFPVRQRTTTKEPLFCSRRNPRVSVPVSRIVRSENELSVDQDRLSKLVWVATLDLKVVPTRQKA